MVASVVSFSPGFTTSLPEEETVSSDYFSLTLQPSNVVVRSRSEQTVSELVPRTPGALHVNQFEGKRFE